jgi:heat shock protein HtpX
MSNNLKTTVLLAALMGLFAGLGYLLFGGLNGLVFFLVLAGIFNFGAYWFSDSLALRMAGAREVSPEAEPGLHAMVAEVARLAGVPKPRVFVIDTESPNAFATGRNPQHAVVAVTTGIRRILTDRELRAVIGHEMGHVKNRDILTSSIAATIAGAISYLQMVVIWGSMFGGGRDREGNGLMALLAVIIAPIVAAILQMALSRTREYQADASGAEYTHDPLSLASALQKLQMGIQMRPMPQTPGTQATSALFIMHPFRMGEGFSNLFSTHPPIEERIKRLRKMAGYNVEAV